MDIRPFVVASSAVLLLVGCSGALRSDRAAEDAVDQLIPHIQEWNRLSDEWLAAYGDTSLDSDAFLDIADPLVEQMGAAVVDMDDVDISPLEDVAEQALESVLATYGDKQAAISAIGAAVQAGDEAAESAARDQLTAATESAIDATCAFATVFDDPDVVNAFDALASTNCRER